MDEKMASGDIERIQRMTVVIREILDDVKRLKEETVRVFERVVKLEDSITMVKGITGRIKNDAMGRGQEGRGDESQ